jgi:hypothetical protein
MEDVAELSVLAENVSYLAGNMEKIEKELSALFFMQCSMSQGLKKHVNYKYS